MDLKKFKDFESSLQRFEESYKKTVENKDSDNYLFFRDSAIQRFEFTVEIFWKLLKSIIKDNEGIICNSPKSCIREFFASGYLKENKAKLLMEMIDDRNMTSHTYHEEVAEIIFSKLKDYINGMIYVYENIK
ncbi:MAG: HI0074 family nucleotidyltransferase substrate-binding subunit [Deltaproteobacteria bacterium]|nr:HI0074 family nucleotidyltransferase substrate-binding subunit [Deltaproteobacteria bacterium]